MRLLPSIIVFSLLAVTAGAQMQSQPPNMEPLPETEATPSRKRPSFLHRAARSTPAEQLQYARSLQAEGRLRKAKRQYLALVHTWHSAGEASVAQEAYARILEERRDYEEAFDEYQYLFDHFAGRFAHADIVDRQFAIAHQLMSTAEKKMLRSTKGVLPMFRAIARNAPNGPHAAECSFYVGWIHETHSEYHEAVAAYEALVFRYPGSAYTPSAAFRRGYCLYKIALHDRRDEAALRAAIAALEQFLLKYGGDANEAEARGYSNELKDMLADMYYERATFYDVSARKPQAAAIAYRDFLRNFPASPRAAAVNRRIAELQHSLEPQGEK